MSSRKIQLYSVLVVVSLIGMIVQDCSHRRNHFSESVGDVKKKSSRHSEQTLDSIVAPTVSELVKKNAYGAGRVNKDWDLQGKLFVHSHTANSREEFIEAVKVAKPGDAILVSDGQHDWGIVDWPANVSGTRGNPIYVIPERQGNVSFYGSNKFIVRGSYIQFSGLTFNDTDEMSILVHGGTKVQIRYNTFESVGKTAFFKLKVKRVLDPTIPDEIACAVHIEAGAVETELGFNVFTDTHGISVSVGEPNVRWRYDEAYMAEYRLPKRMLIQHNTFQNHPLIRENGGESIHLGYGLNSRVEDFDNRMEATISRNLFDRVLGDGEAVSIKSSGNLVFDNRMINSDGAWINIREGDDNVIANNLIEGQTIGFAVSGARNYFIYNILDIKFGGIGFVLFHNDYNPAEDAFNYFASDENIFARNVFLNRDLSAAFYSKNTVPYGVHKGPLRGNLIFQNIFLHEPRRFYEEQKPGLLYDATFFRTNFVFENFSAKLIGEAYLLSDLIIPYSSPSTMLSPVIRQTLRRFNNQNVVFPQTPSGTRVSF